MLALSVVVPLALGSSGCGFMHLPPVTETDQDPRESDSLSMEPIPEGKGRIVFYRPTGGFLSAQRPVIHLNGETVGRSAPGAAFYRNVSPGNYEIAVPVHLSPGATTASVRVSAGETVYVRTSIGGMSLFGRTEVTVVDSATAAQELSALGATM
jgi:hypothetical protein